MSTPARNIRLSDELWAAAQACAAEEGTSVSDLIRQLLDRYLRATPEYKAAWQASYNLRRTRGIGPEGSATADLLRVVDAAELETALDALDQALARQRLEQEQVQT